MLAIKIDKDKSLAIANRSRSQYILLHVKRLDRNNIVLFIDTPLDFTISEEVRLDENKIKLGEKLINSIKKAMVVFKSKIEKD